MNSSELLVAGSFSCVFNNASVNLIQGFFRATTIPLISVDQDEKQYTPPNTLYLVILISDVHKR